MTSIEAVRKSNRRILAFVMALLLCVTLLPAGAMAANTSATSMSLMDWEGDGNVTVKTSSGTSKTARKGMSLYSGYTVKTGSKGKAWIALDGTKTITLSASSSVEIRKSGTKLDVLLNSGELNFSSDGPVGAGKNYNVITQTAVCGIIGSFGWATPDEVGLVHGRTNLRCMNPETGAEVRTTLVNGEQVSFKGDSVNTDGTDAALNQIGFEKRLMTNEDVPASTVQEIMADPGKQAQADEVETLDVHALIEMLPKKLEEELAAADAAQAGADAAAAAQELRVAAEAGAALTVPEDGGTSEDGGVTVGTEEGGKILDLWDAEGKDIAVTGETGDQTDTTTGGGDSGSGGGGSSGGDSGSGGGTTNEEKHGYLSVNFPGGTPSGFTAVPATLAVNGSARAIYTFDNGVVGDPASALAVSTSYNFDAHAGETLTFTVGDGYTLDGAQTHAKLYDNDSNLTELTPSVSENTCAVTIPSGAQVASFIVDLALVGTASVEATTVESVTWRYNYEELEIVAVAPSTLTADDLTFSYTPATGACTLTAASSDKPLDFSGLTVGSGSDAGTFVYTNDGGADGRFNNFTVSGDHATASFTFEPLLFGFTVTDGANAAVNGATLALSAPGASASKTFTAPSDSNVIEVYDAAYVKGTYNYSVTAEGYETATGEVELDTCGMPVSVTLETPQYDITIDSGITHGTVTATMDGVHPVTGAEAGKSVILGFTPDDGYEINAVSVVPDGGGTVETSTISDNGCTFTMPAAPVTVSASFTPRTYAVTLHTNGGTINAGNVTGYTYNTDTLLPTDVTRDGYRFDGWFAEESGGTNSVGVIAAGASGPQEYWAYWTQLYGVTVTTPTNGTVTADKSSAAAGETVTLTATPATGYALDALTVTYGNNLTVEPTQDTTDTTKWSFAMPAGNAAAAATFTAASYAVTLHTNGGTINAGNVTSYTYNTDTLLPTDVTRDGYRFDGWFAEESGGTNSVGVIAAGASGPQEYWAYWTQLYGVTVTTPTNGTVTADKSSAAAGETVTLTVTPATGWELDTLTVTAADSSTVTVSDSGFTMPAQAVTVTATFKQTDYAITVSNAHGDWGGVTVASTAHMNDTVTITVTTQSGYALALLEVRRDEQTAYQITQDGSDDTKWTFTMPPYPVTVNADFRLMDQVATPTASQSAGNVTAGTTVELWCSTAGASVYYTTDGTTPSATNGTLYSEAIPINASMTLKAVAVKDGMRDSELTSVSYTVVYAVTVDEQLTGGTVTADKSSAAAGETVTLTVTPATGREVSTAQHAVRAQYFNTQYNEYASVDATQDGTDPTKWTFTMPAGDATVYAAFTTASYAVTLNVNGGTINAGDVTSYTYGVGATLPTDVTRSGFRFDGWYDAETEGNRVTAIGTAETGAKEYWAYWTQLYAVTVTTPTNGTVTADKSSAAAGETVTLTVTPATGYALDTLTVTDADSGAVTVSDNGFTMPAKAVTVTATFAPEVYPVKLNENGGTFGDSHVQNYTYGVGATLPDDLTRSGFRFDGWYDAETEGNRVTAIGTTETGAKEYWAYWTQLYGVTVADGYANGTVKINGTQTDSADFAAGETVTLTFIGDKPADPEDTGIPYLAGYDGGEVDIRTGGQKVDGVTHVSDVRDLDENTWTSTYSFAMPAGDVDVNAEFRRGFFAIYRSGDSADAQKYYDLVETNMDYSEGYTTLSASDCGFTPPQSGQTAAWSQSGMIVQPGMNDWYVTAQDPVFTAVWGYTAAFNLTGGVPLDDYTGVALFSGEETEEDLFGSDGQLLAEDGETFVIPAGTLVKVRAYDEAIASVSCDDPNVNVSYDESSETYSFTMPAKNAAVTVAYRLRYTLTLAQSSWTGTYPSGGTEYQAEYATAALTADDGSELPEQILPGTKIKLTVTALAEDPQSTPKPVIETNVRVTKDGGTETVDLVMESRSGTDGQHDQRVTVYTFEMPEFNATVSMDFTQEVEGVGVLVYDMETGVTVDFATAADAQSVVASPDGTVSDGNSTFRTARGPDEPMYFRLNFTEQPEVFRVESDGEELTAADGWYTVPEGGSIRVYTVRRTLTLMQTNGTGTVAATAASGAAVTFTSGTATVFAHDTITLTITPPTDMTVSQVWFKPTDGSASGYEISSNYGADNEYSIWPTSYDATVEVTYA